MVMVDCPEGEQHVNAEDNGWLFTHTHYSATEGACLQEPAEMVSLAVVENFHLSEGAS